MLKCWANEFARYQLQFALAMSTNSFEAGEHEGAIEASQIPTFYCNGCKRYCKTKRGLTLHQRPCKENPRNREQSVTSTTDVSHDDQNIVVTDTVIYEKKLFTERKTYCFYWLENLVNYTLMRVWNC